MPLTPPVTGPERTEPDTELLNQRLEQKLLRIEVADLRSEVTALRRELGALRVDFATAVTMLLVAAGRVRREHAVAWVEGNFPARGGDPDV